MTDDLGYIAKQAAQAPLLFRLDDRKAMVVGGSSGLGQAMALALAAAGADVCVVGLGPSGLEETAAEIRSLGQQALAIDADMTVEDKVIDAVSRTHEAFGRIDILINSQGIVNVEPTQTLDMDRWQAVVDVNLKSVVLCCKHVGKIMLEQQYGKIISMASVRGFQGRAGDVAYAPTKGAIIQMTKSLAIEWGGQGITVNALAPTFILTPISAKDFDNPETRTWILSRIPKGRPGERTDMFGPALFLASDASVMINGHTLPVDGGWLCT